MPPPPSSELPPLQPGRKRRAHKRSRNGCLTCKQRHIRCDEVKPICTACLTRGGDCGYPEPPANTAPSASRADAGTGSALRGAALSAKSMNHRPCSPANPFSSLPIAVPHRSLERFNHFATHHIFNPTTAPGNPDTECASLALSNPGAFRASLLSTALSYSWLPGGPRCGDMEETFLSHKLEAMRVVNAQIADPVLRTSDGCLSLIAALALVESGMGNYVAAEAHLKGLFTLIDIKTPQNWQHRLYGLLQRAIAVTGSFIAAAKRLDGVEVRQQVAEYELNNYEQQINRLLIPSPSATSPVPATSLSSFYFGIGTPIIPACKLDIEGLILINALRRLSSMPALDSQTAAHSSRGSSLNPGSPRSRSGTPLGTAENPIGSYELTTDGTAVLLADTDAYTVSLLFKPCPAYGGTRSPRPSSTSRSMSPATSHSPFRSATAREPSGTPPPSASYPSSPKRRADIFDSNSPAPIPSATRAWATAAYLYLHIVLASVWEETEPTRSRTPTPTTSNLQQYHQQLALQQFQQQLRQSSPHQGSASTAPTPRSSHTDPTAARPRIIGGVPVNTHLFRVLLDTLSGDLQHTEEAMRSGSYNRDFWLWKAVVAAYCVEILGRSGLGGASPKKAGTDTERSGRGKKPGKKERFSFFGWVLEEEEDNDDGDGDGGSEREEDDAEVGMDVDDEAPVAEEDDELYMARLGAWFGARLRAWSRAAEVSGWEAARQALERIAWPAAARFAAGEMVAEGVWWRAVGDGGTGCGAMGRPPVMVEEVVVDPRLG